MAIPKTRYEQPRQQTLYEQKGSIVASVKQKEQSEARKAINERGANALRLAKSGQKKVRRLGPAPSSKKSTQKTNNQRQFFAVPRGDVKVPAVPTAEMEIPIPPPQKKTGIFRSVTNIFRKNKEETLRPGSIVSGSQKDRLLRKTYNKINPGDLEVIDHLKKANLSDADLEQEIKKAEAKAKKTKPPKKAKTNPKKIEEKKLKEAKIKQAKAELKTAKPYLDSLLTSLKSPFNKVNKQQIQQQQEIFKTEKIKLNNSLAKAARGLAKKFRGSTGTLDYTEFRRRLKKDYAMNSACQDLQRSKLIRPQTIIVDQLKEVTKKQLLKSPLAARSFVDKIVEEYNKSAPPGCEITKSGVFIEGGRNGKSIYCEPYVKFKNDLPVEGLASTLKETFRLYEAEAKKQAAQSTSKRSSKKISKKRPTTKATNTSKRTRTSSPSRRTEATRGTQVKATAGTGTRTRTRGTT